MGSIYIPWPNRLVIVNRSFQQKGGSMDKRPHENLDVWEKSVQFVQVVYEASASFPDAERYGITSQVRRSAVSIPSNIAEGASRQSRKEFIHFLYMARGSLSELETLIHLSRRLGLLDTASHALLCNKSGNIGKMLTGLISSIRKRSEGGKSKSYVVSLK